VLVEAVLITAQGHLSKTTVPELMYAKERNQKCLTISNYGAPCYAVLALRGCNLFYETKYSWT
jgi:hypothetical protein